MIKGYKEMGQINLTLAELGMTNEVSFNDDLEGTIAQGEY
jgi:CopG family transcriptional regulator/antitoxin EndoAI